MKWVVLFLAFCGVLFYVTGAFTPSAVEPPALTEIAALGGPQQTQVQGTSRPESKVHAIDPTGPSMETDVLSSAGEGADDAVQVRPAASEQALQDFSPNEAASTDAPLPLSNEEQGTEAWGLLLRGAPVHSGPSVSTPRLGYATAGAEMRLLERSLGWVRVRDPATAREGWIYEEHVTAKEGPSEQAALAGDAETEALDEPERSATAKKSRKNSSKKRWRKRLRFVFRRF